MTDVDNAAHGQDAADGQDTALKSGIAKIVEKGSAEPDAVRFHVPDGQGGFSPVTWGEVLEKSRALALYLAERGVAAGDKISVFATTRVEWGFCCPAIEACRAVFVPVYFSCTTPQVHYVIDHSDATLAFSECALLPRLLERWRDYDKLEELVLWDLQDDAQLEAALSAANAAKPGLDLTLDEVSAKVRRLSSVLAQGAALHAADPGRLTALLTAIDQDDLAAIIYTSGTTGDPKGVMLTRKNLAATTASWFEVLEHAFPPPGERRDVLWLPVSHMSGWGILGQGTAFDYETWLADPWTLLEVLPVAKPTMLFSVPAYWEKLATLARAASEVPAEQQAKLRELTGGALRFLLSGGAGLERGVKELFRDAEMPLIEGYGLTECAPNVAMNRLDDFDLDAVGKPLPGVEIELASDGEILVKGDNIYAGYYKDPEATRQTFDADGWFHTGDLGAFTERGFLRFVGRKKEIIVTAGGKNIAPGGIEARFAGRFPLEHVVVYGDERKYLVALVTLVEPLVRRHAATLGLAELPYAELVEHPEVRALVQARVDAVNADLASHETIKKFAILPQPLSVAAGQITPSLKLRRKVIWADFKDRFEALYR